jgi:EmrB/QacA subfamily drug resistance transporter
VQRHSEPRQADGYTLPDPVRWRVLVVLLIAVFMSLIDVSIVNVALPSIQRGLHASQSDIQWVLSGYALTFGIILVAAGRAGDLFGRGGIFMLGVGLFTASSVAAGFAPTPGFLNLARFIQGFGSGLLNPQAIGIIQQLFRGETRGRAFGYFGTVVGISVAIGPVLGGFLIHIGGEDFGWRLTFLVNLPIGILDIILALRWFPRPHFQRKHVESRTADGRRSWPMDPLGALLLGLAVLAILFPFVEFHASMLIWASFPLGIVLIAAWVGWERFYARRGHSPMVHLGIFATRSFSTGTLIVSLYFLGMTSIWVLVALYMQDGLNMSALEASLVGIPSALFSALSANWAGKRVARLGRRIVIGGIVIGIFGIASSIAVVLLVEPAHLSVWWLLLTLVFVGMAQGSVISPNQTLTLAEVPLDYAGSSGAIMQTGQRIGTSIGIAVITAVMFATLRATSWPTATAVALGAIGLVMLIALGVAFKDLRDRARGRG